ncbi:MAG: hypothetical protein COA96_11300 [SAR86 cluster bacterium]|uniref:BAAT/Acyl-CoA thioester hydrolase C-terminal domain-containing protein n=1 Tax=SAR86 cluster bacterium TaxID=2030880 RepID=A0A2A5AXV5_9GAMM|nr:MAG: hypothetical protein COA96_11300 [SAR86 cluster bacterium]
MILRTVKWMLGIAVVLVAASLAYYQYLVFSFDTEALPANHGKFNTQLFLGENAKQPLIVGLGGAEGGNAWTGDYWSDQRERFLSQGYGFLALGYFGMEGISRELDRIPLDGVMRTILETATNPMIDSDCIILIGGSKGAELSLALASNYPQVKAVVAIVPGSAIFAANTIALNTPSFTLRGESLAFVPVPWSAAPALIKGDLRGAWIEMLKDEEAVENASISVEAINGPIFFLSAMKDEYWPSTEMSEVMMDRLQSKQFPHYFEHIAIDGYHASPLEHFDLVEKFLEDQVIGASQSSCAR